MDNIEKLAKAILLTQKLREESFDRAEAIKHGEDYKTFNFEQCYKLSVHKAADKAAEKLGFDLRMTLPIYLLCKYTWNDIQHWAQTIRRMK